MTAVTSPPTHGSSHLLLHKGISPLSLMVAAIYSSISILFSSYNSSYLLPYKVYLFSLTHNSSYLLLYKYPPLLLL
jgi:hypothetical protein